MRTLAAAFLMLPIVVATAPPAFAPELEPEILTIDGVVWDDHAGQFEMSFSSRLGLAKAAEKNNVFMIWVTVGLFEPDGNLIGRLGPVQSPFRMREGATPDRNGRVAVEPPLLIPWDPGAFRGEVTMNGVGVLRSQDSGNRVGRPSQFEFTWGAWP